MKTILPGKILTVIIRDDGPFIHLGDTPTYRSVQIELTIEQRKSIALDLIGRSGDALQYESISKCFIEPNNNTEEEK